MIDFLWTAIAALVPLVLGFIWYNPKVFGTAWMNSAGLNEEKLKGANMPLIFGLAFLLSFIMAFFMQFFVVHQWGVLGVLEGNPDLMKEGTELNAWFTDFMAKNGSNFRTFKHGVLHGAMSGVLFVLPVIAIIALFERKGFKYIAINAGYWIVSLGIMGGLISKFANYAIF